MEQFLGRDVDSLMTQVATLMSDLDMARTQARSMASEIVRLEKENKELRMRLADVNVRQSA